MKDKILLAYWRFRALLCDAFAAYPLAYNPWRERIGQWQADHGQTMTAEEAFRRIRHHITTSNGGTDGNPLP